MVDSTKVATRAHLRLRQRPAAFVGRAWLPEVSLRHLASTSLLGKEGQKMDDGLLLNLNYEGNGLSHRKAADWRSRKREAHEKQQKKRQQHRDNRAAHATGTAAANRDPATTVAAAPPIAESANGNPAIQPQQTTKRSFNQVQPPLVVGQSKANADKQSQHQATRAQHKRPAADSLHGYGAVLQQQQLVDRNSVPAGKTGTLTQAAPASTDPTRKRAKPTNVAALAEAATAAADSLTAGAEADIAALVALNMEVEQQIQQDAGAEPGSRRLADQDKALPHVIEFGDTPDEPDFTNLTQQQAKKHKTHHDTSNPSTNNKHKHKGSTSNKSPQSPIPSTDKQQQLAQHKAGDLTHAEPNVPAEQRQQLFGDRSTAAAADSTDSHSWRGLGLAEDLADHLMALNFQEPTAVQQQTIPLLLGGRDACVRSPTGSGKTLCYLAPLIHTLQSRSPRISRRDGTHALVLVPTRELAVQVTDVLTAVVRRFCWLVPGMLIGGEHRGHEKARLRKGVTVLVATPGRLLDHLQNTSSFKSDKLSWLVLDEADRLLDLGFEQKLKQIVESLDAQVAAAADNSYSTEARPQRQTLLLSATLHPGLTTLAGLSMRDPIVGVGFNLNVVDGQMQLAENDNSKQQESDKKRGAAGTAGGVAAGQLEVPQQLQQRYVEVPAKMRLVVLIGVLCSRLRRSKSAKLVVFFSNCDSVDFHHQLLLHQQQGGDAVGDADVSDLLLGDSPVLKLHGDMKQPERTSSLVTFAKATSCVLLCTDVAARGLDFPAVSTIIQYDPAGDPAEYVHRVGRTARMGQQGDALIFLLPSELPYVQMLQQRGVQVAQELAGNLLKCLPGLVGPAGPSISVLQFARKIQRGGGSNTAGGKPGQPKGSKDRVLAANTQAAATAAAAAKKGSGGFENEGLLGSKPEEVAAALLLQRQLIQTVAADDDLSRLALNAFRSFVRAYTTYPSSVKHVFHVKSLHLGHLAASFGLREAPKKIGAGGSAVERKKRKLEGQKAAVKKQKQAWHKTAKAAAAMGL